METRRGWLTKQGRVVKNWKRRFFVLSDGALAYYEKDTSVVPQGTMNLYGAAVVFVEPPKIEKLNCVEISTPARSMYVCADTKEEIQQWALAIQRAAILASGGTIQTSATQIAGDEIDWDKKRQEMAGGVNAGLTGGTPQPAPTTASSAAAESKQPTSTPAPAAQAAAQAPAAATAAAAVAASSAGASTPAPAAAGGAAAEEKEDPSTKGVKVTFTPQEKQANKAVLEQLFAANEAALKDRETAQKEKKKQLPKWDLKVPPKLRKTMKGHAKFVNVVVRGDGYIASGGDDSSVRTWSTNTTAETACLNGHTDVIKSLACHEKFVISGSDDASIKVWDIATQACLKTFYTSTGAAAEQLAVTDDGKLVIVASAKNLQAWSLDTHKCLIDFETSHEGNIVSMVLYGQFVITGSEDKTIRAWDLANESLVATMEGHKNWVFCMAVSGDRLISGSVDLKQWDLSNLKKGKPAKCTATVANPHDAPAVQAIGVCEDGRYITTASLDGFIKIWELDLKGRSKPLASMENKTKFIFSCVLNERKIFTADKAAVVKMWE